MKAILFGATGMVGQGLLRECLRDPAVEHVLSVVRRPAGQQSAKLSELVHKYFFDFSPSQPSSPATNPASTAPDLLLRA